MAYSVFCANLVFVTADLKKLYNILKGNNSDLYNILKIKDDQNYVC